jgi:hypothetical protein
MSTEVSDQGWEASMPRATKLKATNDAPKVPLRDQILKVADELFYRDGIHVTGSIRSLPSPAWRRQLSTATFPRRII